MRAPLPISLCLLISIGLFVCLELQVSTPITVLASNAKTSSFRTVDSLDIPTEVFLDARPATSLMNDSCENPLQIFVNTSNITKINVRYLKTPKTQKKSRICSYLNGQPSCCDRQTYSDLEKFLKLYKDSVKNQSSTAIVYLYELYDSFAALLDKTKNSRNEAVVYPIIQAALTDISARINATTLAMDKCVDGINRFGYGLVCASCEPHSARYFKDGKFLLSQGILANLSEACYPLAQNLASMSMVTERYTVALLNIIAMISGESVLEDVRAHIDKCDEATTYARIPEPLENIIHSRLKTELLRQFLVQLKSVIVSKGEPTALNWLKEHTKTDFIKEHGDEEWKDLVMKLLEGDELRDDRRNRYDVNNLLGNVYAKLFEVSVKEGVSGKIEPRFRLEYWLEKLNAHQAVEDIWVPTCLIEGKAPTKIGLIKNDRLSLSNETFQNAFKQELQFALADGDDSSNADDERRILLSDLEAFEEEIPRVDKKPDASPIGIEKVEGNRTFNGTLPIQPKGNVSRPLEHDRKYVGDIKNSSSRPTKFFNSEQFRKNLDISRQIYHANFEALLSKDPQSISLWSDKARWKGHPTMHTIKLPFPALFASSVIPTERGAISETGSFSSSSSDQQLTLHKNCPELTGATECFICSEKNMRSELCANNVFKGFPRQASFLGPIIPAELIYRDSGKEFVRNFAFEDAKAEAAISRIIQQRGLSFEEKKVFYEELEHAVIMGLSAHTKYYLQSEDIVLKDLSKEVKAYINSVGDIFRTLMASVDTQNRYVFNYELDFTEKEIHLCIDQSFCWNLYNGKLVSNEDELLKSKEEFARSDEISLQVTPTVSESALYDYYCTNSSCFICVLGNCFADPTKNLKSKGRILHSTESKNDKILADRSYTSLLDLENAQLTHRSYCDCTQCYSCWSYSQQEKCQKILYQRSLPQYCTKAVARLNIRLQEDLKEYRNNEIRHELDTRFDSTCDNVACNFCWLAGKEKSCKATFHPDVISVLNQASSQLRQKTAEEPKYILSCYLPKVDVSKEALNACADEVAFRASWNFKVENFLNGEESYRCMSLWNQQECLKADRSMPQNKKFDRLSSHHHILYNYCKDPQSHTSELAFLRKQYSYSVSCTEGSCQLCQWLGGKYQKLCHNMDISLDVKSQLKSEARGIDDLCKYVNTTLHQAGENYEYCNCNGCYICETKDGVVQCKLDDYSGRKPSKSECSSGAKKDLILNNEVRDMREFCAHVASLGPNAFNGYSIQLERSCSKKSGCKVCMILNEEQKCYKDTSESSDSHEEKHNSTEKVISRKTLKEMCNTLWLTQVSSKSKSVLSVNEESLTCATINSMGGCETELNSKDGTRKVLNIQGICAQRHYFNSEKSHTNFKFRSFCNCSGCYYCEGVEGGNFTCEKISETVETLEPCKDQHLITMVQTGSLDDLCGLIAEANLIELVNQRYYCDCSGCYSCLRYFSSETCKLLKEPPVQTKNDCNNLQLSSILHFSGDNVSFLLRNHPEKIHQRESYLIRSASVVTQLEGDFSAFCKSMPVELLSQIRLDGKYFCNCTACYRCFRFSDESRCSQLWWNDNPYKHGEVRECQSKIKDDQIQPATLLQLCLYQGASLSRMHPIALLEANGMELLYPFYGSYARVRLSFEPIIVPYYISPLNGSCWNKTLENGEQEKICLSSLDRTLNRNGHIGFEPISRFELTAEVFCNDTSCYNCISINGTSKCFPLDLSPNQNISLINTTLANVTQGANLTLLRISSLEDLRQLEDITAQVKKWNYRTHCRDADCYACITPTTLQKEEVCFQIAQYYEEGEYDYSSNKDTTEPKPAKSKGSKKIQKPVHNSSSLPSQRRKFEHGTTKAYNKGDDYHITGWVSMQPEHQQESSSQNDVVLTGKLVCLTGSCKACFAQTCVEIPSEKQPKQSSQNLQFIFKKDSKELFTCLDENCYIKGIVLEEKLQERSALFDENRLHANHKNDLMYSFRVGRKLPDYINLPDLQELTNFVYYPPTQSRVDFERWLKETLTSPSAINLRHLITPFPMNKEEKIIEYTSEGGYNLRYDEQKTQLSQSAPSGYEVTRNIWYDSIVRERAQKFKPSQQFSDGTGGILRNTHGEVFGTA